MSDEAGDLAAYYIYLMNGGTREGYESLNIDDMQGIYTTYVASRHALVRELLKGIVDILKPR